MDTIVVHRGSTASRMKLPESYPFSDHIFHTLYRFAADYIFNNRFKKSELNHRYWTFNASTRILTMPIEVTEFVVDRLRTAGALVADVQDPPNTARDLTIAMKDSFVPRDDQVPIIDYIANHSETRKGISAATGFGKTVSAIAGMVKYGKVGMIVVSGLVEQWYESILKFTTTTNQCHVIRGFDSVAQMFDEPDVKPEIFVFSLETLRLWCRHEDNYRYLPTYEQFLKDYGVGTKIMDEVHLNFYTDTMIDLQSNIANNIYMTATFANADKSTLRIFNLIYPVHMRKGDDIGDRYIDVYTYYYYGLVSENKTIRAKKYNHFRYEIELLKSKRAYDIWYRTLVRLINAHYINRKDKGERCVIFVSTKEMILKVVKDLEKEYPSLSIDYYIYGRSTDVFEKADIILTTLKGCGCGRDVPLLRTVINTISFKALTTTKQCRGRLRKLKSGNTPEYIELVDMRLDVQCRHAEERKMLHLPCVKMYRDSVLANETNK